MKIKTFKEKQLRHRNMNMILRNATEALQKKYFFPVVQHFLLMLRS